jgi:hypothetical protein
MSDFVELWRLLEKVGQKVGLGYLDPNVVRDELNALLECCSALPTVDCDMQPSLQSWEQLSSHKPGGKVVVDLDRLRFYASPKQRAGQRVYGGELILDMDSEHIPGFNACMFEHLQKRQDEIPERFRYVEIDGRHVPRKILFPGTVITVRGEGVRGESILGLTWQETVELGANVGKWTPTRVFINRTQLSGDFQVAYFPAA